MDNTLQIKRGTATRLALVNPLLKAGEPCSEYNTGRLKIGDGIHNWNDLPYVGDGKVITVESFDKLPKVGDETCVYKVLNRKTLFQWNAQVSEYESLIGNSFDPSKIILINGGNAND